MRKIVAILLFLLVLPLAAQAGDAPDLNTLAGEWTYAQTVANDVYVDPVALTVGDKGLTGVMTYKDGEESKQDVFSNFAVDSRGRLTFVTTRPNGRVVRHTGEFSNDGNTIRGNYNLGMGVGGRFVLDRVTPGAPPCMSGRWEYVLTNPADNSTVSGDALLLGDSSGWFEGYLHYRNIDTSSKKIEGTTSSDNTLHFEMYEKKTYVHDGTFDAAGTGVEGTWTDGRPGSNRFTMKKFTE